MKSEVTTELGEGGYLAESERKGYGLKEGGIECESPELYRKLFENATDMIITTDAKGRYVDANPAACETLGYARDEFLLMDPLKLVPEEARKDAREFWDRFTEEGEAAGEIRLRKKNGDRIVVEHRATAHFVPGLHLHILRDVTSRKMMEERLRLSYKNDALGALTGGIAHDFNNLLAIILGNVELCMYEMPENFPLTKNMKEIGDAARRAKDLVSRLLAFSRKTEVRMENIDMASTVEQSAKLMKTSIPRPVEYRWSLSDDLPPVMADPGEINQLIIHLANNAVEAMGKEGGVLEIVLDKKRFDRRTIVRDRVLKPGYYVKLTVRDTGRGIADSHIPRIFDPYFTTKELGKGAGMGLSTVHGIVKVHMGAIQVESQVGKGSEFTVFFPASEPAEPETTSPAPAFGNEKILLVDDEKPLVKMEKIILEKMGYRVETFVDAEEALACFEQKPGEFDLVITDMAMPRMDGDELAVELLKIRPGMPIILCTGFSEQISEKKAREIGIGRYVKKPCSASQLANVVREVLDESKANE